MTDTPPDASLPPEQPADEKVDRRKFNGAKPGEARKRGHVVTDQTRLNVNLLTCANIRREVIAEVLGISINTLEKKYKKELAASKTELTKKAVGQLALGISRGNMTAVIFWLKTQGGFREGADVHVNGMIPVRIVDDVPDTGA